MDNGLMRKTNGIPDLRNGEHRWIQKQIDLYHAEFVEFRRDFKATTEKYGEKVIKNEERSQTNRKFFWAILMGVIGIALKVIFF